MGFYIATRVQGFMKRAFARNDKYAFARGNINIARDSDRASKHIFGPLIAIWDFLMCDFAGQMIDLPILALDIGAHRDGGTGPQGSTEIFIRRRAKISTAIADRFIRE